jgi:ABC-2 type transport system permease protein
MILGLKLTVNLLLSLVFVIPVSLFFISLGLLFGTILNDKAVGGICGALLTNLSAWLSGTWFDLDLVGGIFKKIAYCLPFVHAVDMERAILNGNFADAMPHLVWVLVYAFVSMTAAVILFFRQMKKR